MRTQWDVGMATPLHAPSARGYDSWLGYWHHANDYWSFGEGTCSDGADAANAADRVVGLGNDVTVRDLWRYNRSSDSGSSANNATSSVGEPAFDLQNADFCSQAKQNNSNVTCVFEEQILVDRVLDILNEYGTRSGTGNPYSSDSVPMLANADNADSAQTPLFLVWSCLLYTSPSPRDRG